MATADSRTIYLPFPTAAFISVGHSTCVFESGCRELSRSRLCSKHGFADTSIAASGCSELCNFTTARRAPSCRFQNVAASASWRTMLHVCREAGSAPWILLCSQMRDIVQRQAAHAAPLPAEHLSWSGLRPILSD